jgi:hypothetical protein
MIGHRTPFCTIDATGIQAYRGGQKELLKRLSISPFDARLRLWRETARKVFEQSWAHAVKLDIYLEEEKATAVYNYL